MAREDQPAEQSRRHGLRILFRAPDRGLHLSPLPLDVVGRERRPEEHVGQEVQPEPEVLAEDGEGQLAPVAAALGVEAPADELDRPVDLERAAGRGAQEERERGEVGQAGLVGGVEDGSGADRHPDGHDRERVTLGHEDDQPVGKGQAVGEGGRRGWGLGPR